MVKKGLDDTQRRMAEKSYRSAAEMVLAEFPEAQRNKQGDYGKALNDCWAMNWYSCSNVSANSVTLTLALNLKLRFSAAGTIRWPVLGTEAAAIRCRPPEDAGQMHSKKKNIVPPKLASPPSATSGLPA
ncbi:MAG: hypothetical protein KIS79_00175 [Burkholderiales bacterium]|nr:hypothetical protein [Burkholderiales bacterium]